MAAPGDAETATSLRCRVAYCSPLAHFHRPLPTAGSLESPVTKPDQDRRKPKLDRSWSGNGLLGQKNDGDGVEMGDWVAEWDKTSSED